MSLSDEQIQYLITCRKRITKRPKRQMTVEARHRRNDFELQSDDGEHRFSVFMRQSTEFPENFSIGLNYLSSSDGSRVCLIRCNGPHGGVRAITSTPEHHFYYHIHMATQDAMERGLRAESSVSRTDMFSTFEEAFVYFARSCSIVDVEEYFPFYRAELNRQIELFEDEND